MRNLNCFVAQSVYRAFPQISHILRHSERDLPFKTRAAARSGRHVAIGPRPAGKPERAECEINWSQPARRAASPRRARRVILIRGVCAPGRRSVSAAPDTVRPTRLGAVSAGPDVATGVTSPVNYPLAAGTTTTTATVTTVATTAPERLRPLSSDGHDMRG